MITLRQALERLAVKARQVAKARLSKLQARSVGVPATLPFWRKEVASEALRALLKEAGDRAAGIESLRVDDEQSARPFPLLPELLPPGERRLPGLPAYQTIRLNQAARSDEARRRREARESE